MSVIQGIRSDFLPVHSGYRRVNLGPLLFCMYINDICDLALHSILIFLCTQMTLPFSPLVMEYKLFKPSYKTTYWFYVNG